MMMEQELESRLFTAMEHAAPDQLDKILSHCQPRKGTVIFFKNPPKKKRWLPALAAACLTLAVAGGGMGYYAATQQVASVISLDVNPSVELKVNRKETVLSATPTTQDAVEILEGMDLKGTKVDVAMNAIVGSLLKHGYVDELANSILITVEDKDALRGAQLQQELTAQADAMLANAQVNGAILSQTIGNDTQLHQQAEAYGISAGKASLIQAIVDGSNGLHSFEELVGLSINELNLLYSSLSLGGNPVNPPAGQTPSVQTPIQSSGQASDGAYIGLDAAKEAALVHAKVSQKDAIFQSADFDYEHGRMVYELEFLVQNLEYEYDIDALTGEVVKYQMEQRGGQSLYPPSQSQSNQYIGEEAAKAKALAHAGLAESDTVYCDSWLEYDDGWPDHYEVEFMTQQTRYEYEIGLLDGAVLKQEQKQINTVPSTSQDTGSQAVAGQDIGMEKAKSIALNHAGVRESNAGQLEVKSEWEHGRLEYEVEFQANGMDYEYKIDGISGTILSFDHDIDD